MVHDCGKNKCTTYIKERMLLDKHRCQNDADRQNQCQETDQLVFAQLFIVCHRKINAERIIYMDTDSSEYHRHIGVHRAWCTDCGV